MLRDRLVFGIADRRVRNRYLRETKLSYVDARDMALAAEAADKDAKQIQAGQDRDDSGLTRSTFPTAAGSSHAREAVTVAHVDRHPPRRPRSGKMSPRRPHPTSNAPGESSQPDELHLLSLWWKARGSYMSVPGVRVPLLSQERTPGLCVS